MTKIAKAFSIVFTGAVLLAGTAFADPATTADATTAATTAGAATSDLKKLDSQVDSVATGSINVAPTNAQRMADCMATWDKGTHMTKDQWRRTCKTMMQEP